MTNKDGNGTGASPGDLRPNLPLQIGEIVAAVELLERQLEQRQDFRPEMRQLAGEVRELRRRVDRLMGQAPRHGAELYKWTLKRAALLEGARRLLDELFDLLNT
jgi:hypothetical protein